MCKRIALLFIFIILLTGCSKADDTVSQDNIQSQETADDGDAGASAGEGNSAASGSTYEVLDETPITIVNPVNGESVSIALNDSFNNITNQLSGIGLDITSYEYQSTVPTLIDQLEQAINYQSTEEANANASNVKFFIDPENYSFQFIDSGSTNRLTSVIIYNTLAATDLGIRCGDNVSKIIELYGDSGFVVEDEMSTIYIFEEYNNLTFVVDPTTDLIINWSMNVYGEAQQDKETGIWQELSRPSSDTTLIETPAHQ